jgi:hypothetical protein
MIRILVALLFTTSLSAQSWTIRCTAGSEVMYEAQVEGATDFDVVLADARFELNARFTAEGTNPIDLRVDLRTRRHQGVSANQLPLWEEDHQRHRMRVVLGQLVELLPFGSAGPRGLLKLEIVPRVSAATTPRIDIRKSSRQVRVQAHRLPHWYEVRARLGSATATALVFVRDSATLQLGDATITLTAEPPPHRDARNSTLVRFDGRWRNGVAFAQSWEGIATETPLRYPVRTPRGEPRTLVLEITPRE